VDNIILEITGMQQEVEDSTLSAYLWSRGIIKVGYDSEWGWNPKFDVLDKDNPVGATPTQANLKGHRIEFNGFAPGMPWVRNVLPHDFCVPFGTRRIAEAPWTAHRVIRHIEDLRDDPKYENVKSLEPNMSREDWVRSYQAIAQPFKFGSDPTRYAGNMEGKKAEYVELWEIHDRRTGKVMVLATSQLDKFLRNDDDHVAINGHPFVSIGFVPNARTFWTTSDAEYLRWSQAELTDIAIQTSKQRRISIMKFLYRRGAITQEQLDKLMSNTVGAGVEVEMGEDLDKIIKVFQPSQNPQVYNEADETRKNARETVGFSRNQFGEFDDSSRRTATEVNNVQQNSNLRMSRRQLQVRNAYIELFQKINPLLFNLWKAPRVAQVLDKNGVAQWMQFTGDHIRGLYKYDVGFSADSGETRQSRQQNAIQLYQMLLQDPAVDQVQARRFLARAFNDPRFSSIYKPGILEGDPNAAAQLQMLQMQQGGGNPNPLFQGASGVADMSQSQLPGGTVAPAGVGTGQVRRKSP
jgi:hypothetical protein